MSSPVKKQNMWRREVLVVSAALPAAVNLLSNVFVVRYLGLEQFGIWLIWRTGCQLTSNISPGYGVALSVLLPKYLYNEKKAALLHWLAQKHAFGWGGFSAVVASFFVFFVVDASPAICFSLVLFWTGLYFSGFTGAVSRGYRDGRSILLGSMADACGSILSVIAAYHGDFALFVVLQALRMWVKGLVQYYSPFVGKDNVGRTALKELYVKKVLRTGFPLVIRGWIQTALQYGDRFLIGSFLGPVVGGIAGMGSMLAMPTVIVASSSAAWLLPVMLSESKSEGRTSVVREISLLLLFVVLFSFFIPILPFFVPDVEGNISLVSIVYFEACLLSIVAPIVSAIVARGKFWYAVYVNSVVALIVLSLLAIAFLGYTSLVFSLWLIMILVSLFVVSVFCRVGLSFIDFNNLIAVILLYFVFVFIYMQVITYVANDFFMSILSPFLSVFLVIILFFMYGGSFIKEKH